MEKNVGTLDMIIRLIATAIIAILGYYYQSWWGLLALVPLATGLFRYCPAWTLFRIRTDNKK